MWNAKATQKLRTFFSKNIGVYAIFNVESFNDTLTNNVVFNNWAQDIFIKLIHILIHH